MRNETTIGLLALLFVSAAARGADKFEYGGFIRAAGQFYPRTPNPSDTHANGTAHLQLWSRVPLGSSISWRGMCDLRLDTHRDVDRSRWLDVADRGLRIPAGSLSEFYFDFRLRGVDVRAGKQAIRWGRADGFNPTDNLVPYDYLDTFADIRIPVTALKVDAYAGSARFEFAWVPFFTPTRLPLFGQRWYPQLPGTGNVPAGPDGAEVEADLTYAEVGRHLPARTFRNGQWGVRWNQLVPGAEFSLSYFDGHDDLPFYSTSVVTLADSLRPRLQLNLFREYYRVRVVGADFASAVGPIGVRGEAAWFDQTDPGIPDHLLFVIGLDRSWGDWFAIFQYAGQNVAGDVLQRALFPELAFRSTALWRLERSIGPSSSLEVKGAVRLRDGDFLFQPAYSVALTNRLRVKLGASIFCGNREGYLGQYRDSGGGDIELRYTF